MTQKWSRFEVHPPPSFHAGDPPAQTELPVKEADSPPRSPHGGGAEEAGSAAPIITLRALVLGLVTITAMFYYLTQVVHRIGSGTFVHSQFPMAVIIPFVLWLFLNVVLKRLWPRMALRQGELLTILVMMWVVGTIPQHGWINFWAPILAAPTYFASAENQWADTFFDFLPWSVFPPTDVSVIDGFWFGLPRGAELPWAAWMGVIFQWLGVSMAMLAFGFCTIVLFHRQWEEREKLTFPLAQMPLDLMRGFDGPRRMPDLFRRRLFWIGALVAFLPILYNITTYFTPGLTTLDFLTTYRYLNPEIPYIGHLKIRYMPIVMAVTYLCPLDILGSLVLFRILESVKVGIIHRVGYSVGSPGQQISGENIVFLENYGALMFIAMWAIWIARRHLRELWRLARTGEGDPREVRRYRLAWAGLLLSAAYVLAWAMSLGVNLFLAAGVFALMVLTLLATTKLIAATGFAYLMPYRPHLKGDSFVEEIVGTAKIPARDLTALKIFTSKAFFGTFLIPAWPAISHILRMFSLRRQPGWVTAAVFTAFPVGFVVAAVSLIELVYTEGGAMLYVSHFRITQVYEQISHILHNRTAFDLEKLGVFMFGWTEAGILTYLRARFHWFPLHPVGLAFEGTFGPDLYWSTLAIVWVVKLTLLRYAGVKGYLAGKPFFYGLGIGYVGGVILSATVDLIWFPSAGHRVHWW